MNSRTRAATIAGVVLAGAVITLGALASGGGQAGHLPPVSSTPAATSTGIAGQRAEPTTALEQLSKLTVAAPDEGVTYRRSEFGPAWADVDGNHCRQREDVLRRDLVDITIKPGTGGCVVSTGILHDPYSGRTVTFQRGQGTSELVQVDHVVPIGQAARHGAAAWSSAQREAFANDLINLQATIGSENQAKGDKGPAAWMPQNTGYQCTYAERFVAVLSKYQLTVSPADAAALRSRLSSCPR